MQTIGLRLLRVAEAAKLTGIERWRFYSLLRRGEGPAHLRVGRTIRIPEAKLVEWIEANAKAKHDEEVDEIA